MPIILTHDSLKLIKLAAKSLSTGIGSSHLSEAIAAGFGYRTNISLQTALERGSITVELSDSAFRDRITSIGVYHCRRDLLSAALQEATMRRIHKIADQYPRMTLNGLNPSIGPRGVYKTQADWEASRAEFFSSGAVDMFLKCELWLAQCKKGANIYRRQSSYGMKHSVEEWLKQNHPSTHHYVANGAFIAAAVANGFEMEEFDEGGYKCLINMATMPSIYLDITILCERKNTYEITSSQILALLCEVVKGWLENRKAKKTPATASFLVMRGLRHVRREVGERIRVSAEGWSVLLPAEGSFENLTSQDIRSALLYGDLKRFLSWRNGKFPYTHVPWAKPVKDRGAGEFSDEQPGW